MSASPVVKYEEEDSVLMLVNDRDGLELLSQLPLIQQPLTSFAISSQSSRSLPTDSQNVLRLDYLSPQRPPETQSTFTTTTTTTDHTCHGPAASPFSLNGLTNTTTSPRTSINNPDSHTLVAHHGLPNSLPALPSLTSVKQDQHSTDTFDNLSKNYINMVPSTTADAITMPPPPVPAAAAQAPAAPPVAQEPDMNALLEDIIRESPHLQDHSEPPEHTYSMFSQFLTSPYEDYDPTSPLFGSAADFTSPGMGMMQDDFTSPLFEDANDFFTSPLFADSHEAGNFTPLFTTDGRPLPPSTPALVDDMSPLLMDISSPQLGTPLNAVGTYDTVITEAPSLFSEYESIGRGIVKPSATQLHPSPNLDMLPPSSSSRPTIPLPRPGQSRRVTPTGTRRNITPQSLVPLDAPTQNRKYIGPSSTARKEVPLTFARKRAAAAVAEADDEEFLPDLPPNATEKEQIEWKRRQNTIAARKSRKRKLEHQQHLEDENEALRRNLEVWKTRAITLRGVMRGQGQDRGMEEWDDE